MPSVRNKKQPDRFTDKQRHTQQETDITRKYTQQETHTTIETHQERERERERNSVAIVHSLIARWIGFVVQSPFIYLQI